MPSYHSSGFLQHPGVYLLGSSKSSQDNIAVEMCRGEFARARRLAWQKVKLPLGHTWPVILDVIESKDGVTRQQVEAFIDGVTRQHGGHAHGPRTSTIPLPGAWEERYTPRRWG